MSSDHTQSNTDSLANVPAARSDETGLPPHVMPAHTTCAAASRERPVFAGIHVFHYVPSVKNVEARDNPGDHAE
jgi:hypothetical protein